MASNTAPTTAPSASSNRISRWFLRFTVAAQLGGLGFGTRHGRPTQHQQRDDRDQAEGVSGDDEWPGIHADAIRRIRASILLRANSARIRISTIAPNKSEKPTTETRSGHSIEASMVELRLT